MSLDNGHGKKPAAQKASPLREFLRSRQHPIKIIGYTSKTLWLLLIPIGKNLVTSHFDIQGWLRTYWMDLFFVVGILFIAVFRWLFVFYEIGEGCITAHTGPFGVIKTTLFFSQISAVRVDQGLIQRAVHASTLHLETQATNIPGSEIKLVISQKSVDPIFELICSKSKDKPQYTVESRNRLVMLYSVMFSSTFSGLLIFGTVIWQASKMAGSKVTDIAEHMNDELHKVDEKTLRLSETVPSIILLIGAAIITGWLISFASNLLNNWDFSATRHGVSRLTVRSGKFKHDKRVLDRSKISYYDIRQSLLMKLASISSVHLQCSGFGRKKKETAAIIPMTKNSEMSASFKLLEPSLGRQREQIRPERKTVRSFVGFPLALSLLPFAAGTAAKLFVNGQNGRINTFILVLTVPLVWLTVVQFFAFRSTSFGMTGDTCTLCFCPRYQFHKVIIPIRNISMIQVRQNPIQRIFGSCTVAVYAQQEKRKALKASRLPYKQVCELLAQYVDERFIT